MSTTVRNTVTYTILYKFLKPIMISLLASNEVQISYPQSNKEKESFWLRIQQNYDLDQQILHKNDRFHDTFAEFHFWI